MATVVEEQRTSGVGHQPIHRGEDVVACGEKGGTRVLCVGEVNHGGGVGGEAAGDEEFGDVLDVVEAALEGVAGSGVVAAYEEGFAAGHGLLTRGWDGMEWEGVSRGRKGCVSVYLLSAGVCRLWAVGIGHCSRSNFLNGGNGYSRISRNLLVRSSSFPQITPNVTLAAHANPVQAEQRMSSSKL